MTCLEFRRQLLTDPRRANADMIRHVASCTSCRAAADAATAFERQLQAAFDAAEPLHLTEPAIPTIACGSRKRQRRWILSGSVAATLLLAAFSAYLLRTPDVSDQAMSHLQPYTLAAVESVPAAKLREVLGHAGATVADADIRVTYAANCTIERKTAAHLVIPSIHGLVTVFLMPRVSIDRPKRFADDRWVGRIEPFGAGSVALIALQQAALDDADARIRTAFAVAD
jgi:hypothetical protein